MTFSGLRLLPVTIAVVATLLTACRDKDTGGIDIGDSRYYPTMTTTNVSSLISDSGYTRYHLEAPSWLMYEEADTPYWKFPEGIDMQRYDDTMRIETTFHADSAIYLSTLKIWQFDGRVNMLNADGDRFATNQLFWDQNKKTVYSDSFMHIERADRIIEGYGFQSNEQITEYTILQPQMIIPVERLQRKTDTKDSATQLLPQSFEPIPIVKKRPKDSASVQQQEEAQPKPAVDTARLHYKAMKEGLQEHEGEIHKELKQNPK